MHKKLSDFISPRIGAGLILVAFLSGSGCKKKEKIELPPIQVEVVKAIQADVPIYEDFIGQTFGKSDVNVRSRVEGWVTSMNFKEGSTVRKGNLLYTIDDIQYRARVDRSASDLAGAKTELVRAQSELNRVKPLAELNALSKTDLDNAVASYEAAQAQVQASTALLESSSIELGYTRVYAPFDGVIGISNVRVGDFVSRAGATSVLTTISNIGSVRIRFQLSEREYLRIARLPRAEIQASKKVQLILADGSTYPFPGEVNFANREVDPKSGTMTIEASFPNPEGLLRPGLFVKVRVLTATYQNVILVPQRAVTQLQSLSQVFLLSDSNTLKVGIVETGPKSGDGWVISKGLKAGDQVAIVGAMSLTAASKIAPVLKAWPEQQETPK